MRSPRSTAISLKRQYNSFSTSFFNYLQVRYRDCFNFQRAVPSCNGSISTSDSRRQIHANHLLRLYKCCFRCVPSSRRVGRPTWEWYRRIASVKSQDAGKRRRCGCLLASNYSRTPTQTSTAGHAIHHSRFTVHHSRCKDLGSQKPATAVHIKRIHLRPSY